MNVRILFEYATCAFYIVRSVHGALKLRQAYIYVTNRPCIRPSKSQSIGQTILKLSRKQRSLNVFQTYIYSVFQRPCNVLITCV